jgi:hypothetical protein
MTPTAEEILNSFNDAKDSIARAHGFDNWKSVDWYQLDAMNETKPGEPTAEELLLDQAAKLYARRNPL